MIESVESQRSLSFVSGRNALIARAFRSLLPCLSSMQQRARSQWLAAGRFFFIIFFIIFLLSLVFLEPKKNEIWKYGMTFEL